MSDTPNFDYPKPPIQNVDISPTTQNDPRVSSGNPDHDKEALENLELHPEEKPQTYCRIFLDIGKNGTLGALVFLLLISSLLIMCIYAGHLPSSEIFVSAMGIGSAYFGIGSSIAFGLNAGFNVLCSRCNGTKDWVALRNFFNKQVILINGFNVILFIYVVCCVFWFDVVYATNPALLYWTRIFMVLCYPTMCVIFNIDIFREMFIGLQVFVVAFFSELTGVVIGTITMYFLCYSANLQFIG